jgi:hypothetical protein
MSRKATRRRPERAGTLLEQLVSGWGMAEKLEQYRVWQIWAEVVGEQIAAHATPVRIRDHRLEVRVDQAVWMQQLHLLKPKIIAALNQRLGSEQVCDIFWRQGPPAVATVLTDAPAPPSLPPLDAETAARIEALLANLPATEIGAPLRRLLQKQARLAAWRRTQSGDDSSSG